MERRVSADFPGSEAAAEVRLESLSPLFALLHTSARFLPGIFLGAPQAAGDRRR